MVTRNWQPEGKRVLVARQCGLIERSPNKSSAMIDWLRLLASAVLIVILPKGRRRFPCTSPVLRA